MAEEKEKDQNMVDRIKYLFDHKVHLFPQETKKRKELNQKILDVMNRPKPLTWQPLLPRNAEPVQIIDLFNLLEKTRT